MINLAQREVNILNFIFFIFLAVFFYFSEEKAFNNTNLKTALKTLANPLGSKLWILCLACFGFLWFILFFIYAFAQKVKNCKVYLEAVGLNLSLFFAFTLLTDLAILYHKPVYALILGIIALFGLVRMYLNLTSIQKVYVNPAEVVSYIVVELPIYFFTALYVYGIFWLLLGTCKHFHHHQTFCAAAAVVILLSILAAKIVWHKREPIVGFVWCIIIVAIYQKQHKKFQGYGYLLIVFAVLTGVWALFIAIWNLIKVYNEYQKSYNESQNIIYKS